MSQSPVQLPQFEAPPERVLSTLNPDGTRRWLRPKTAPGRIRSARGWVAWGLIAIFTLLPWIRIDGRPLLLLDVVHRQFTIFGTIFRPTDTLLLTFLALAVFASIFALTALFGRVWCGWACPQTVYLEFVYRPLQRFFEGRAYGNSKLRVAGWRRLLMYATYLLISAHLANTFLAYFVGTDQLVGWTLHSPTEHPTAFIIFAGTTALMMFDFVFFREQLCTLICPYGRFQSVLLDRDSLIVGYDEARGEPRGRRKRKARATPAPTGGGCSKGDACCGKCGSASAAPATPAPAAFDTAALDPDRIGDCVDCTMCVQVCPTGIDIRDGLQLECIHCAQCVDACNSVMRKLGRPEGLIRYGSQNGFAGAARHMFRPRVVIYPLIVTLCLTVFGILLASRGDALVVQKRMQAAPYAMTEDGLVRSTVFVRIDNRTEEPRSYRFEAVDGATIEPPDPAPVAEPSGSVEAAFFVLSRPEDFDRGRRTVTVRIHDDVSFEDEHEFDIMGPFGDL